VPEGRELRPAFVVILQAAMVQALVPLAGILSMPFWIRLFGARATDPPFWIVVIMGAMVALWWAPTLWFARRAMERSIVLTEEGLAWDGRWGPRTLRFDEVLAAREVHPTRLVGHRWEFRRRGNPTASFSVAGLDSADRDVLRRHLVEHLGTKVTRQRWYELV
jgi:hypothetical protein